MSNIIAMIVLFLTLCIVGIVGLFAFLFMLVFLGPLPTLLIIIISAVVIEHYVHKKYGKK